jgi:hypothetical protein
MRNLTIFIALALLVFSAHAESPPPLIMKSGEYTFQHRFAEHPNIKSIALTAKIDGTHIQSLTNQNDG